MARGGSCNRYDLLAIPLKNFIPDDERNHGGLFGYEIVSRDRDQPASHPVFVNRGRWIAYSLIEYSPQMKGEIAFFDPARGGATARPSIID